MAAEQVEAQALQLGEQAKHIAELQATVRAFMATSKPLYYLDFVRRSTYVCVGTKISAAIYPKSV